MREKIEYSLVKLFLWLAKITPKSFIYALMKCLTLLVYHLDKKRRNITIRNLTMAFSEKTSDEIMLLSKTVYTELSKTISEILFMFVGKFDIDKVIKNEDEAKEKLQKIAQNSPHGVIVVTAHFSNWELAAHFLARNGLPMLAIGREGNNKLIDQNITLPFRNKYGNRATSKDNAMLAMAKTLKKGDAVGLLIDQKTGQLNSVNVDFFGRSVDTTSSVAMLKFKFNPVVVPIFVARQSDGLYEMIINDPIDYVADEIEDKEKKLEAMTLKYNQAIENIIREYPAQWFWMHNRWRI
ncbi:MAG: lysophospholipid acyltransferase family protein [Sulfurovum sp.]|uniref:lysophospholipid acyltransferase family protein n=1 Tax=Sulfurovum sp. TaxID=1969726 RepID=UPI002867BB7E|nr:lysophospholipid acyltransferase family protein [Sulfurovum sp.]MCO4846176.1 lysophospholipid acyltransferase family protein [Sulfurovum sp.]